MAGKAGNCIIKHGDPEIQDLLDIFCIALPCIQ